MRCAKQRCNTSCIAATSPQRFGAVQKPGRGCRNASKRVWAHVLPMRVVVRVIFWSHAPVATR